MIKAMVQLPTRPKALGLYLPPWVWLALQAMLAVQPQPLYDLEEPQGLGQVKDGEAWKLSWYHLVLAEATSTAGHKLTFHASSALILGLSRSQSGLGCSWVTVDMFVRATQVVNALDTSAQHLSAPPDPSAASQQPTPPCSHTTLDNIYGTGTLVAAALPLPHGSQLWTCSVPCLVLLWLLLLAAHHGC